jgi:hypothetical protein
LRQQYGMIIAIIAAADTPDALIWLLFLNFHP